MKKSTLKKILAALTAIALVATAAACSDKTEEEPIQDPIEVSISIDFPEGSGVEDITDETFLVEDGTTVLDALQIYCNVNDIPVNVETTSAAVFGINGVNNSDVGSIAPEGETEPAENDGDSADNGTSDSGAAGDDGEKTEEDIAPISGSWHYSVNGEEGTVSENEVQLSDGDSIIWIYQ